MTSRRSLRSPAMALVAALLTLSACDDHETSRQPIDATTTTTTTVALAGITTSDSAMAATDQRFDRDDGFQEFDVEGVRVVTHTGPNDFPAQVTEIEFRGMVIDGGSGPEMCVFGVADSYPPQCDGPVVDGLEMGEWTEVSGHVAFGERTIQVSWPPQSVHVTLITERTFERWGSASRPTLELPPTCADIEQFVSPERLSRYAADHPDTTARTYRVLGGETGVLRVSGDIEKVRADLSDDDAEPCLEPVRFSTTELERAQSAIGAIWNQDDFNISSTGSGNAYNRVTVDLVAADAATVRRLAAVVDDPEILLVFGNNLVLAGT